MWFFYSVGEWFVLWGCGSDLLGFFVFVFVFGGVEVLQGDEMEMRVDRNWMLAPLFLDCWG